MSSTDRACCDERRPSIASNLKQTHGFFSKVIYDTELLHYADGGVPTVDTVAKTMDLSVIVCQRRRDSS